MTQKPSLLVDPLCILRERRSIQYFETGVVIPEDTLERILDAALYAPSAFNLQPWRLVVITTQAVRERLSEAAYRQRQIRDSSAVVIVCCDLRAWEKDPANLWSHVPEITRCRMVENIRATYSANAEMEWDEAMRAGGLVAMALMIAAKAEGYDTCPMTGFDFKKVAGIVALPEDHVVCMAVAIGKTAVAPLPRGGRRTMKEMVFHETFPQRFTIDNLERAQNA